MICFNCGLKLNNGNEIDCKFCGVRFSGKCPSCNFPHPKAARYCFNCGGRLTGTDGLSSVENYGTLSESRKNVAVMFADVSGFTALSEKLDPEEVREIINECFNHITSPVYELEGTIDKYIGDCVMILFGARYSHTDDAKRSVLCAMKMLELISDFSRSMLSSRGLSLNLSIGINYGLVVTGGVGNYFDRDYTVMGDIVNTAQRLQMSAGEGAILVSESVFSETNDKFEYSETREVKVKNKENPVKCYSPLRISNDYYYEKELSFIERQKEIGLLNSIYNDSLNSGLKFVMMIGETGIGKTRLLKEFSSKLGNDIKKVWAECSAVSQNKTYSLIISILSGVMNINTLDSINMRKHRLISFLDYILDSYNDEEIKRNYDFLGLLMGLDRDSDFQSVFESMNYDSIRRELLKQLSIFFSNLCKKQRLVVMVDDSQWADPGSIQLLNDLIPLIREIKAVFLFSTRYELKNISNENNKIVTHIRLNSLSKAGIKSLSCALLNTRKIDDMMFDAILKFTNGNPLYIKELLTNIKRKGVYTVKKGLASINDKELKKLPESIQNLIISNVSALDPLILKILQAAATVGKEFSFSMLVHLLDQSITEEDVAGIPVQLNIIELKSTHTSARSVEKIFAFNHEIEREVIYEGILNKEKALLHRKIAEYIEVTFSQDIENYYEVLCLHLVKAGMLKKAADYYFKAAVRQKELFNLNISLEYFNSFIKLVCTEKVTSNDDRIFKSYREIGHIHFINANYDLAFEYLNKALENTVLQEEIQLVRMQIAEVFKDIGRIEDSEAIIDDLGTRIREGSNTYGRWLQLKCNLLRIKGDTAALSLARKSEKIILKSGDYRSLSETMKHAGMIYFGKGDIDNALAYMNKSYKYAEKNNLLEIMAKVSGDLGIIYHSTGLVSKALEFFNKSMEISKQLSYQRGIIAACINLGVLHLDKGQFVKARELFVESLEIAKDVGSKLYECVSLTNLGDTLYEIGDIALSNKYYHESLCISRELKATVEEAVNLVGMAKVNILQNEFTEAASMLEIAKSIFEEADEVAGIGDCQTYLGLIAQKAGDFKEADIYYEKAIDVFTECRNDKKRLKVKRFKAAILLQNNRNDQALKIFDEVICEADSIESNYEAAKSWFAKYQALKDMGELEAAVQSINKAKESISKVDECQWKSIIGSIEY